MLKTAGSGAASPSTAASSPAASIPAASSPAASGSKPDSVWSTPQRPFDGDDCGETDDKGEQTFWWWRSSYRSDGIEGKAIESEVEGIEREEPVNYEEASADGKEGDSDNKITGYWPLRCL